MPPMSRHESTDEPVVDADVVDDENAPVTAAETVEGAPGTVEGVPVLAEVRAVESHSPVALPAVQAAAVAATGFVAGAATLALVRRHSARKLARRSPPRRALDALPIVGSRSFLVDVHLIARDS
jgi:hypothetical protein